jgi:hypothetical protein
MSNKYSRKPVEECLQFFLQKQSDELVPGTAIYKEAVEEKDVVRNEVINVVAEEFRDSLGCVLEKYDESFVHCTGMLIPLLCNLPLSCSQNLFNFTEYFILFTIVRCF